LRAGDGARTHDSHVGKLETTDAKDIQDNDLRQRLAALTRILHADPDLARVVEAWLDLSEALRRAVLALVGSANG
jgi:hypothetical protein